MRKELPGRVWAHDGKYEQIDSAEYQNNVYNYIWTKQHDAWIWSFKDGEKTTWIDDEESKEEE